ncbi:MAG: D-tyrosyl-tRNA(Tyr) deacylase [Deltaproteobacteria bacterium]|nr:MAG: D-tyrosyl-tRNA(Tyr) deacylase [Deltaproteobacteria bacterium]
MIAVVQRVTSSSVSIGGNTIAAINAGVTVLLGVADGDGPADADYLANKVSHLRIFEDAGGRMNRSLIDTGGRMLVISQFTLLGDCRKGRRPSFVHAAEPSLAAPLYERFVDQVQKLGVKTHTGRFGANMQVHILNDGPVTLLVHSR